VSLSKGEERKEFYERHKPIAVLMIVVVLLLPIVGAFLRGLLGAALGVAISIAAYYLTPYVVLRLRA
jgi:hypothetical protein